MRHWRRVGVGLVAVGLGLGTLAPGADAAPYCGQVWGSLLEQVGAGPGDPEVRTVRAAQHACFDRVVIDLASPATGYRVSYVPVVEHQGSGAPLPLRGGAFLDVTVWGVPPPGDRRLRERHRRELGAAGRARRTCHTQFGRRIGAISRPGRRP